MSQASWIDRLVLARKAAKLSQERLASLAGIDRTSLARYESGNTAMSVDVLLRLTKAIGVDPGDLLNPTQIKNFDPLSPPGNTPESYLREGPPRNISWGEQNALADAMAELRQAEEKALQARKRLESELKSRGLLG